MTPTQSADDLVRGFMNPWTIGDLINSLQLMNPADPVFCCEVGNIKGAIKWKRKETWKQWVKKQTALLPRDGKGKTP